MSNLRTLYTNLAAMSVTFTKEGGGNSTPTAKDLHQVPKGVETADLPVRVLLPMWEWNAQGIGLELMSAGATGVSGEMLWNVTDLLLWEAVGQTRGFMDVLPDLVRYSGAYASTILDNRILVANTRLVTIAPRPGSFEFPQGSGRHYFGVEVLLTFKELINP